MKRRYFLKGAALTSAGSVALAAPAIAQEKKVVKMITTWPKDFPGLGVGAQRIADAITNMTDSRLTVKLFAAGEMVPAFESFETVSSGTAEMYHASDYYWQDKHKAFNFFATVPLGFTASEHEAWMKFGGGQELYEELTAKFGLKSFNAGNTGVQMGGWYRNPIKSLDDMKGLKMLMPGLGGEVLQRIGASAVSLPGSEIFPALQAGSIDAVEWAGPYNDMAFGFHKVLNNYMYPGFHEPGSALTLGMNKMWWDSLSRSDQAIIAAACSSENDYMSAEYNARNSAALQKLISEEEVQLHKFPDQVWDQIAKLSEEVVAEVANVDDLAKRIFESYILFRNEIAGWSLIGEESYLNNRTRALADKDSE